MTHVSAKRENSRFIFKVFLLLLHLAAVAVVDAGKIPAVTFQDSLLCNQVLYHNYKEKSIVNSCLIITLKCYGIISL